MDSNTFLLSFLAILIAGCLSYFQYIHKAKNKSNLILFLAFLRFLSVFGFLILLINPIITNKSIQLEKTPLPIIVDNSSSIADLKADKNVLNALKNISENKELYEKYDIQTFQFDSDFLPLDSLNFKGTQSNFDVVAESIHNIYKNKHYPSVLITDGNQTSGNDYVFGFDSENKIYPLVVGDTTTYMDLKISQINVNKYAFHKNKFPVEIFLNYAGTKNINASFKITQNDLVLVEKTVSFSSDNKSAILNVLLPADKVGLQIFKATVFSKEQEKNSLNNVKNFAIDVMEQKTEVALITNISHPDLGVLKRSIESNEQRKVTVINVKDINDLSNYDVLILYQPTSIFKKVIEFNNLTKINTWIITGNHTDFNFLNQIQNMFSFKMSSQKENYLALFENQFNLFALEDIGFNEFPPLENTFGTITSKGENHILLNSSIRNIPTNQPLLVYSESQGNRFAFLFGENIWKWRAKSYQNQKRFSDFDLIIDKTIQYLASNDSKKSLVVNHERFYNSNDEIEITAQYFNKNYELDEKASLTISLINTKTNQVKNYDLLRTGNAFKVNLNGLNAGNYRFTVKELNSNTVYFGTFEILDFDIEKQFVNPDWNKLNQLASHTNGKAFLSSQTDKLINTLLNVDNYKPIQKTIVNKSPIIEWYWLLLFIVISLATEWFIRKYNGLL